MFNLDRNNDNNGISLNLTILGRSPTGLGVYAERSARYLEGKMEFTAVAANYETVEKHTTILKSPKKIAIGGGRLSSIFRIIYMLFGFPIRSGLVYSPTQHGLIGYRNQIITVHDMICLRFPKQHRIQYYYFKWLLPLMLRNCRAVFTVSETTKNDIVRVYGVKPENIFVIPNGVDTGKFYRLPTNIQKGTHDRYLLTVGASYRHKNIEEVLSNWRFWKGRFKYKIASCSGRHRDTLKKMVDDYDLTDDVEFLGYVADQELVSLYQHSAALIAPSLWEGFGITPLESLACGRPVIVSDISAHKEVLGDAAIYISNGNENTWEQAFRLLENELAVKSKFELGAEIVKKYSWENAGEILVDSLLSVEPRLENALCGEYRSVANLKTEVVNG